MSSLSPAHLKFPRPLNETQLDEALPYILAAPKDNAPVSRLCYRPDFTMRCFTNQLELSIAKGVIGDRWFDHAWIKNKDGSPDKRIQISILPQRILDLVWRDDDGDESIHPGDTMIADLDMSEENLPIGSYLKIGTAILQVSDEYNGACKKWMARYGDASFYWFNRADNRPKRLRGILCEIMRDGIVTNGDVLQKISEQNI